MVSYTCETCDFKSHKKSNLNTHILTHRHIDNIANIGINTKNSNDVVQDVIRDEQHQKPKQAKEIKEYKCLFCNKLFSTRHSLSKHKNHRCTKKNNNDKDNDNIVLVKELLETYKNNNLKLEKEALKLEKEALKLAKENKQLKQKNEELYNKLITDFVKPITPIP
jgi:DNA-directed RNA polymerase subunit RPC12/RpoP